MTKFYRTDPHKNLKSLFFPLTEAAAAAAVCLHGENDGKTILGSMLHSFFGCDLSDSFSVIYPVKTYCRNSRSFCQWAERDFKIFQGTLNLTLHL
jgi:hypothetical protein